MSDLNKLKNLLNEAIADSQLNEISESLVDTEYRNNKNSAEDISAVGGNNMQVEMPEATVDKKAEELEAELSRDEVLGAEKEGEDVGEVVVESTEEMPEATEEKKPEELKAKVETKDVYCDKMEDKAEDVGEVVVESTEEMPEATEEKKPEELKAKVSKEEAVGNEKTAEDVGEVVVESTEEMPEATVDKDAEELEPEVSKEDILGNEKTAEDVGEVVVENMTDFEIMTWLNENDYEPSMENVSIVREDPSLMTGVLEPDSKPEEVADQLETDVKDDSVVSIESKENVCKEYGKDPCECELKLPEVDFIQESLDSIFDLLSLNEEEKENKKEEDEEAEEKEEETEDNLCPVCKKDPCECDKDIKEALALFDTYNLLTSLDEEAFSEVYALSEQSERKLCEYLLSENYSKYLENNIFLEDVTALSESEFFDYYNFNLNEDSVEEKVKKAREQREKKINQNAKKYAAIGGAATGLGTSKTVWNALKTAGEKTLGLSRVPIVGLATGGALYGAHKIGKKS